MSSMADSPADPDSFSTSPGDAEGRAEPSGRSGGEQQDLEPERRYDLESTNGRVRVAVAARPGVGYRFQLYSVEGRISLGLDDISHVVNQVSEPGGSIQVESFNYQQQPRRVAVQVRSLNGPIQVESGTL